MVATPVGVTHGIIVVAAFRLQWAIRVLCLQPTSVFEQYGGIEYYLDDLLRSFSEGANPDDVQTIIARHFQWKSPETPYSVQPVRSHSGGWRRRLENRLPLKLFFSALRIARRQHPSLILCGHVSYAPIAWLLSRIVRKPLCTIVYGIEAWGNLLPQDEWCLRRSSWVISISDWTKNILVNRGYDGQKIHVIHPVISKDLIGRRRVRDASQPFTLLTVSRLDACERYKGHDDVIEALPKVLPTVPNVRYIIQGSGSDKSRLEHKVAELGLQRTVEFHDQLPSREDLRMLYATADVFIMPSRFGFWDKRWKGEGFGIVYAEAGALGVPSIAYRCGGAMDIIEHGSSGLLVNPESVGELAHAILYLATHPEELKRMGENARTRVNRHFTSIQMNEKVRAFVSCLGGAALGRPNDNVSLESSPSPRF